MYYTGNRYRTTGSASTITTVLVRCNHMSHGVRCRGGAGGGRTPQDFGETYFNTFRPPPDFGGFCRQFGILCEKNKK